MSELPYVDLAVLTGLPVGQQEPTIGAERHPHTESRRAFGAEHLVVATGVVQRDAHRSGLSADGKGVQPTIRTER